MKDLIITGASGFVGRNLTAYMSPFGRIVKLDARTISTQMINLEGEAIVHLAGKAHDLKKTTNFQEYYDVNYELTKRLFDAFLESDLKKFIFVSSVKAAADMVSGTLSEELIPNPQTHYGKSKLMAEEYIQSKSLPEGKFCYILRPCMIHGPGNKGNLNLLYKLVAKGIPYPLASFDNKRSFLSIDNFCFVIEQLINSNTVPSGIYQLADDEPLSTNNVVSILSQSLNRKSKLWYVPRKFIQAMAKIGDAMSLPFNTERLKKLTENYVVSNVKIKNAIGKKLPMTSRQGLLLTATSFKN